MKCAPAETKKCKPGFISEDSIWAVSMGAALAVVSLTAVSTGAALSVVSIEIVSTEAESFGNKTEEESCENAIPKKTKKKNTTILIFAALGVVAI